MKNRLKFKILITISLVFLIAIGGILIYREQNTNKPIPKKATLVYEQIKRGYIYG